MSSPGRQTYAQNLPSDWSPGYLWDEPSPVAWAQCPIAVQRLLWALQARGVAYVQHLALLMGTTSDSVKAALAWARFHGLIGVVTINRAGDRLWAATHRGAAVALDGLAGSPTLPRQDLGTVPASANPSAPAGASPEV